MTLHVHTNVKNIQRQLQKPEVEKAWNLGTYFPEKNLDLTIWQRNLSLLPFLLGLI